jgi:hypothetical protein
LEIEPELVGFTLERKKPEIAIKREPNQTVRPSLKVKDVEDLTWLLWHRNYDVRDDLSRTKKASLGWKYVKRERFFRSEQEKQQYLDFMKQSLQQNLKLLGKLKRSLRVKRTAKNP